MFNVLNAISKVRGRKMNEEKSLREEINDVKKIVKDIAAKLHSLEIEMRKHDLTTYVMLDERYDVQPKTNYLNKKGEDTWKKKFNHSRIIYQT